MRNFSTWLLVAFMTMFWGFRAIMILMTQSGSDMGGLAPLNVNVEIVICFIILVCLILIVKRKMFGGIIYLATYGLYFGASMMNNLNVLMQGEALSINNYTSLMVAVIGIVLPIALLIDLAADSHRKENPKDKKTDWFYGNEKFDREMDDRADKNNYRTL